MSPSLIVFLYDTYTNLGLSAGSKIAAALSTLKTLSSSSTQIYFSTAYASGSNILLLSFSFVPKIAFAIGSFTNASGQHWVNSGFIIHPCDTAVFGPAGVITTPTRVAVTWNDTNNEVTLSNLPNSRTDSPYYYIGLG